MSFVTQIELLIYIRNFRNVDLFQQGMYRIQISIPNQQPYLTLDQLGIVKQTKLRDSRLKCQDIVDNNYLSSQFWIRYEDEEVVLGEGCIFRIEQKTFQQNNSIELKVDLFFQDSKTIEQMKSEDEIQLNKISSQTFVIHSIKQMNHNYLPIIFESNVSCLINSLIFSIPLNIKYHQQKDDLTFLEYIQKYQRQGKFDLLYQRTFDYLENIFKLFIQQYKETVSLYMLEPSKFAHYLSQLSNLGQIEYNNKDLECQLNTLSQQLYIIWYIYIDIIAKVANKLMKKLKLNYIEQLQNLYEDFIIQTNNKEQFDKAIKNINFMNTLRQLDQRILPIIPITYNQILDNLPIIIKFQENQMQKKVLQKNKDYKHLIIFVHGYKGSPFDMRRWRNIIKTYYPKVYTFQSSCNQRQGEESIKIMGHKLSIEIQAQIQLLDGIDEISFICHSLGGVIARSALTSLKMHADKMKFFLTLGSPHIGLFVKQSNLVRTGLWFMTNFSQSQSMVELLLQDAQDPQNSYLYYLSTQQCLNWFDRVILISSIQDDFVPYEIARLEQSNRVPQEKKLVYEKMLENIQLPDCTRIEVNFTNSQNDTNWDNFIGRTAHMNLVENETMIRMIVTQSKFLDQ